MKYTNEAFTRAKAELDRRREISEAEFHSHETNIQANYPEINRVYREIKSLSRELSGILLSKRSDARQEIEKLRQVNISSQRYLKELLVSFGLPEDYLIRKHVCEKCSDYGFSEGKRCECFDELLIKYTVEELNRECLIKPRDFSELSLDYYPDAVNEKGINPRQKMSENINFCKAYVKTFSLESKSVFMVGPTGLGKTMLSSCIANGLIKNGFRVAFDSIQNYLRAIENEHFGRALGKDTLDVLLSADLVILDDLGSEFQSAFNSSVIYNIINSRCNKGVPTIISTNLTFDELQDRYDDRIVSRLTGMFTCLRFIGNDIRMIKRRNGEF